MNACTPIEHELKFVPTSSTQIKLRGSLRNASFHEVIDTFSGVIGLAGDYVFEPSAAEAIVDIYFDTNDLDLFKDHASFRLRQSGREIEVTIKRQRSQELGEFKRDEIKFALTAKELLDHERDGYHDLVKIHFPRLTGKQFRTTLIVKNSRRTFLMHPTNGGSAPNPEEFRASVSFDVFNYSNPKTGHSTREFYELEIEADTESASRRLGAIGDSVRKVVTTFIPSEGSKYERGVQLFYLDRGFWIQFLVQWGASIGLNWISLLITTVGTILGAIGLWLTIKSMHP